MENDLPDSMRGDDETLYRFREHRLSWLAYLNVLLKGVIACAIGVAFMLFNRWVTLTPLMAQLLFAGGAAIVLFALGLVIYRVLYIRRVRLYSDRDGVWCYRGILPWRRGVIGTNWRDLRQASYGTGFLRWLTKAYPIQVDNRFTDTDPIVLANVHRGHEFVGHVNAWRNRMLRQVEHEP
ncbi:hypothetical protein [Kushneria phosphatilytica]|uniref:QueT transporter family protein n=1 Tax=Kushneria phosphatilytica TaxID=657387 RepID=A0A5C0ZVK8_9GAMM|nr:hypothetical protein [Kushneria phosphatilytica]QEL09884.1 QueT transporter family protein [Kushneria phosphatilytica]